VLAFSAISVAFNIVHAAPTVVARLVAAIPPGALVLSFELLMRQLRAALRPADNVVPATGSHVAVTATAAMREPRAEPATSNPGSPLVEQVREICAARQRANSRVTGSVLARELGISDGYARRLLRQLAVDGQGTT
jgi:hypothetical protein